MAYIRGAGRTARHVRQGIVGRDGTAVWHQAIGAAAGLPRFRRRAKSRAGCDFEWPSTSGRASLPLQPGPGIAWGVNFSADGEVLAVAYDNGGKGRRDPRWFKRFRNGKRRRSILGPRTPRRNSTLIG